MYRTIDSYTILNKDDANIIEAWRMAKKSKEIFNTENLKILEDGYAEHGLGAKSTIDHLKHST